MKTKVFVYLCIYSISISCFFINVTDAVAEWRIEYSDSLINQMRKQGRALPKYSGHYRTKSECMAALNAISTQGFNAYGNEAKCVEVPDQYTGGGSVALPRADLTTETGCQAFMTGMMINMISGALNPQNNASVSAAAYTAQQEAIAAETAQQALEERHRKWDAIEDPFNDKKKKDMANLLDILGPSTPNEAATDSGSLDGFFSVPVVELKARGTSSCDTSALSMIDRLRCATYFSNKATEAAANGDNVNARYLNEQAQKAMSGQIVDEPVQFAALPDIPEAPVPQPVTNPEKMAEYDRMINVVQQDITKLQDIDMKLKASAGKVEQAEEKKHQAEQLNAEYQNRAGVANTPEEKKESDALLAQAQALLQDAESELKEATDDKENYVNEKESITSELKAMQKSIQNPAETD